MRGATAHIRAKGTATRILARHPEIVDHDFYTRIVCGRIEPVIEALAADPRLASKPNGRPSKERSAAAGDDWLLDFGTKGWEPLLYLCFTRLDRPETNDNAVAIARALLARGANPNAYFMAGGSHYTPLTGVIGEGEEGRPGHPKREELVKLLLGAGAEPFDVQVFYNLNFKGEFLWYLKLIYEHCMRTGRTAEWQDPEWKMIDMGGYGFGASYLLSIAIEHGDSELTEWLLSHGANPDAVPRFGKRKVPSMYELAMRQGQPELAELLVQHGASRKRVALTPAEQLAHAVARADASAARDIVEKHPALLTETLPMFAFARLDDVNAVTMLLDLGVSTEVADEANQRPLHVAAYDNALKVAKLLLDRGAEIDPYERRHGNTPLGFACYARNPEMIELLSSLSCDIWELTYVGKVERVREIVRENPARAKVVSEGNTPLMWLPIDDEGNAMELAALLIANGADATLRNEEGHTAAHRAARMGMFALADLLQKAELRKQRPSLEQYQAMADVLLEAYRTGTPEAMERLYQFSGNRRSWESMRTYLQLDLGKRPSLEGGALDVELDIDDARHAVARTHSFASWRELEAFVSSVQERSGTILAKPAHVWTRADRNSFKSVGWSREVNALIEMLKREGAPGLDADNGQMTDAALAELAQAKNISSLSFSSSNSLTDAGLAHLRHLPHLRHLDLSGTAITDIGLKVLRELPFLETLSLSWTRVTDAGVECLRDSNNLRRIDLGGTRSGDGALRILRGKPHLASVRTGNGVTDAGLELLHDFPVFKSWKGGEVSMGLTSYDASPNYLMLRGPFTDEGMKHLAGLNGLFALNIDASELRITSQALEPLIGLPNLGWLAVDAKDDWMPYIAAMRSLRFLGCQDTMAGDDGFVALGKSESIEYIWGRRCHNLRDVGFKALGRIPTLRALSVSSLNVSDSAVASLPEFPSLRELMPMDIPDEGYRHIGRCSSLESLVLMYCRDTGDRATEHIASLPRLAKYFNSYTHITDHSLGILSTMDSLEEVTIYGCPGITDAGVAALARLPRLRKIDINGQNVTPAIAAAFPPSVHVKTPT